MKIILAITFVYGVLRLLTYTKIFNTKHLVGPFEMILETKNSTLLQALDILSLYISLIFQAYYWLF